MVLYDYVKICMILIFIWYGWVYIYIVYTYSFSLLLGASIKHASARLQRNRFIILSSYERLGFYSRVDCPDMPIFGHEKSLPGQQKLSALLGNEA